MNAVEYLKGLNLLSIFFSISYFLINLFLSAEVSHAVIYLCVYSVIMWIIAYRRGIKSIMNILLYALLVLPMLFSRGSTNFIFCILGTLFILIVKYKRFDIDRHAVCTDVFRKGLVILSIISAVTLIFFDKESGDVMGTYVFVFLISGTFLMRTMRYRENIPAHKGMDKANLRLCFALISASFLFSMDFVRTRFLYAVDFMLEKVGKLIELIAVLVFTVIGYAIQKLVEILSRLHFNIHWEILFKGYGSGKANKGFKVNIVSYTGYNYIMIWVIKIIIIAVLSFIVIKYLLVRYAKREEEHQYKEVRESLSKDGDLKDSLWKRIKGRLALRSPSDFIRYYYRKYLVLCMKNGIEIIKSDTSMDVNERARTKFDSSILGEMRDIYVRARYSEHYIAKESAGKFSDKLKAITRTKNKS